MTRQEIEQAIDNHITIYRALSYILPNNTYIIDILKYSDDGVEVEVEIADGETYKRKYQVIEWKDVLPVIGDYEPVVAPKISDELQDWAKTVNCELVADEEAGKLFLQTTTFWQRLTIRIPLNSMTKQDIVNALKKFDTDDCFWDFVERNENFRAVYNVSHVTEELDKFDCETIPELIKHFTEFFTTERD